MLAPVAHFGLFCLESFNADRRRRSRTAATRLRRHLRLGTVAGHVSQHAGAAYRSLLQHLCRILALVSLLRPRHPMRRARAPSEVDLQYHRLLLVELTCACCLRWWLVLSRSSSSGKSHYLVHSHSLLVHLLVMRLDELHLRSTCSLQSQSLTTQASDALQQGQRPLRRRRCQRLALALRVACNYEDQHWRREVGRAAHHQKERTARRPVRRQT